ncbi:MFS transporter [Novosphingobium sp. ERN07]|uniref:MFS transporter n=1 Tax=Novosphingobium sp. ERN07 TaxID=2726187 RepID=UPI0014568AAD|nr:MFS transporter [Novosphingobium sp. ERN07]NLR73435.1 MFS transporter [Novosphingobium sp. ERN07]
MYALAYLDRQVLTLLVDPIRADFGISDFEVSLVQGGAFVLFFVICAIPIGWAVDRFSRCKIIFAGVFIWSLASAFGGLASSYWQLLISRFGVGAGEAALAPAAYSLMGDLVPRHRLGFAMAVFSIGAVIGGAISLALGGYAIHLAIATGDVVLPVIGVVRPWQLVLLVVGLVGLPLSMLALLLPEPVRVIEEGQTLPNWVTVRRQIWQFRRFYGCHILGFSMLNLIGASFVAWAPTVLIRTWQMPVAEVGATLAAITVTTGLAGMLFSGYFADRMFRNGRTDAHFRYYVATVPLLVFAGAAVGFAPSLWITLTGMVVCQFVIAFIAVAAAGLQIATPPLLRGRISSIFLFIYNAVGYAVGPSLVAMVATSAGGDITQGLGLVMMTIAPIVALVFAFGLSAMREAVAAQTDFAHETCARVGVGH